MPNWVKTIVRVAGSKADKLAIKELVKGKDSEFDFNKIIPTPDNIFQGNLGAEEMKKYGKNNWYDWDCANWGTKWNASEAYASEDGSRYDFQTAWSVAEPVLEALSKKFPKVKITCRYADEDIGSNCGTLTFLAGELVDEEYPDDGRKSKSFATRVWGYQNC
jgi:hypothetical protein